MNTIAQRPDDSPELLRKSAVYSVLDDICRDLELTEGQLSAARTSYETVAEWLSKSTEPFLSNVSVYAHGSAGLGTSVKPLGREDFDVDLICLAPDFTADRSPAELKRLVGDRLRENATYARMLEEKKRCWRLNYAREFHLDISPTIVNLKCMNGGELVPDKKLRDWKPTNPSGYKALFEARAKLKPRVRLTKSGYVSDQANVEPFPSKPTGKGVLRRTVQLLKRHRDIHFQDVTEEVAPISIIITTLAAQAYECCHRMFTFDTELDVLVAIVRMMPHFIERRVVNGRVELWVVNETTEGENFADRWNTEPARAQAFFVWHAKALSDFENAASVEGIDRVTHGLEDILGSSVVRRVMDRRTEAISTARDAGKLFIGSAGGLTLSGVANAAPVPRNTHFGG
ncbi:MAG: nucleotidyltransferase [Hyphomicrobiaceae bacterium]|nr:nucleotidyltransferase [Hyphomicrobiaceae bacterium]